MASSARSSSRRSSRPCFADPQLAEELRSLALLRDLLAGLPREAPADVTSRVMRRVRRRALLGTARPGSSPGARSAPPAWPPSPPACSLMLALPWFLHIGRGPAGGRGPGLVAHARCRRRRPGRSVSEARWPAFSSHTAREGTAEPGRARGTPPVAGGTGRRRGSAPDELVHVREYLDNPQLRRIFLVSDLEDGSAEQQVASVVEQTTRFNFYKITISQGIVIDPRHPDRGHGLRPRRRPPRAGEPARSPPHGPARTGSRRRPSSPAVVTQLADIGHVEACPPSPAAEMDIPRDAPWPSRIPTRPGRRRGRGAAAGRTPRRDPIGRPPSRSGARPPRSSRPGRSRPLGRAGSPGGGRRRASGPGRTGTGPRGRTILRRPGLGLPASPGLTVPRRGAGPALGVADVTPGCRPGICLPGDTSESPCVSMSSSSRVSTADGRLRLGSLRTGHRSGHGTGCRDEGLVIVDMIQVDRLSRRFGSFKAVDDVSFAVGGGEVVGLLGPNGAGQDDDHADAHDVPDPDQRPGDPGGPRRARRAAGGPRGSSATCRRACRSTARCGCGSSCGSGPGSRTCRGRGCGVRWPRSSPGAGWRRSRTGSSASSRGGSASGWGWPRRCSTTRRS